MSQLTKDYILDHKQNIHTFESFSRALGELVLTAAAERIGDKEVSQLEIPATFIVSPVEATQCIRMCANIGGVLVCYHVDL